MLFHQKMKCVCVCFFSSIFLISFSLESKNAFLNVDVMIALSYWCNFERLTVKRTLCLYNMHFNFCFHIWNNREKKTKTKFVHGWRMLLFGWWLEKKTHDFSQYLIERKCSKMFEFWRNIVLRILSKFIDSDTNTRIIAFNRLLIRFLNAKVTRIQGSLLEIVRWNVSTNMETNGLCC